ncbi:hypothetical protein [Actinacidiphila glaucinigra]|uniref:hypothetical protein n=1 Tax=Actinacidiphila glaucinigra TaxID=235986 RepID=UPI0037138327
MPTALHTEENGLEGRSSRSTVSRCQTYAVWFSPVPTMRPWSLTSFAVRLFGRIVAVRRPCR